MKSKTIKAVLRKKFDTFAKSIKDKKVRKLVKKNSIITGGSIASMLMGEEVNDYDVYFTNAKTVRAVARYYTEIFNYNNSKHRFEILDGTIPKEEFMKQPEFLNRDTRDDDDENNWYDDNVTEGRIKIRVMSKGVAAEHDFEHSEVPEGLSSVEDGGSAPDVEISMTGEEITPNPEGGDAFRPVYISSNAITLADDFQLIIRFFGDAEEIHSNYDFAHCTCSWTSKKGDLLMPSEALECLLTKELRYSGSKYPLASIIRSRKFITRGFTINAGQYLKMCMQLNEIDLRDLSVLEDQLTGVDAMWFAQMLAHVDEDHLKDDTDNIYFFELINRFF